MYDFARPAAYAQAWRGGFGLGALGTLILIGSMTVRTWGRSSPVTREQARLILWGAALSFGPILYFLVSRTFHYPTLFNVSIYFPPFVALPLMTAYAIVRYRALKTDFVVARVFLYLTLVAIVGLFYAALVTLPAALSGADLSGNNPFFIVTFIVIVVVLMGPIRGRLATRIDSLFYFGTTGYHEHLEQFSRQLTASVDVDHVLAAMKRHIVEVLQPETVTAFIINTDQTGYEEQDSAFGQAAVRFDYDSAIASYLREIDHTVYLAPGAALPAELRVDEAQLTALGANLLLALHSRSAIYGWLLLGPRRSGRPYRYRDINFIEVLRDQAAPAIDRALLFEDLKRSETRFRAVVDTSAAAIFIFQGNSLIFVNPETTVQTGYAAQELLEMDIWDLVHPKYRELVRERSLTRRPDAALDSRFDIRIIRKDGHERWLDVALNNYVHEGRPAIIGASIDITEKKHMEMALRDSEERFRQAFERGPLGTMIVNDDLEILRANEAMCSMLGYSEDELTSGAFLDITHPDDADS
ncbi:MAG: PAS domain-containing protein, partial [Methyloligellaceae bacterium]